MLTCSRPALFPLSIPAALGLIWQHQERKFYSIMCPIFLKHVGKQIVCWAPVQETEMPNTRWEESWWKSFPAGAAGIFVGRCLCQEMGKHWNVPLLECLPLTTDGILQLKIMERLISWVITSATNLNVCTWDSFKDSATSIMLLVQSVFSSHLQVRHSPQAGSLPYQPNPYPRGGRKSWPINSSLITSCVYSIHPAGHTAVKSAIMCLSVSRYIYILSTSSKEEQNCALKKTYALECLTKHCVQQHIQRRK